ncbi:MAG: DNA cytosine methyltransferase [Acidimicrobiales bacterium]
MSRPTFKFVDLFSGIGGFHAALSAMGGECVYAVEIDPAAAAVYQRNWGMSALGDITADANETTMRVPRHDVLCAGFPCQPFSKSGAQRGMEETRGTLYWNILKIIQVRRPAVVLLENVRNLAGPRHQHEWDVIIDTLRLEGYRVSEEPAVFSPHLLPRELGGRPQVRERVFITATRLPKGRGFLQDADPVATNRPVGGWDPKTWNLTDDLPLDADHDVEGCDLTDAERLWIDAWDDFVQRMWEERQGHRLPGFPLWADYWVMPSSLDYEDVAREPKWKADFIVKNAEFYAAHRVLIDDWTNRWAVYTDAFPPSRRKLEWQAQDTPRLWDTVMHFRPSGIRAKRPTYLPALVAITQTSIIGSRERRLSPREAARLQGLPEWFDFGNQRPASTYRQLGNGVSVGAVWHVLRSHAERDQDVLKITRPRLLEAALDAPESPDEVLERMRPNRGDAVV